MLHMRLERLYFVTFAATVARPVAQATSLKSVWEAPPSPTLPTAHFRPINKNFR